MVEKWLELLDSITPRYEERKLDTHLYDILEQTHGYRPGDEVNMETARQYITAVNAFIHYRSKHGDFSDMFGDWMAHHELFNSATGQFLTPINVVECMAEISLGDAPDLAAPQLLCDPASGTGRFMLASAKIFARNGSLNMVFVNIDIDFMAYVFGLWNGFLNNIPSIHINGDSLAVKGWRGYAILPWSLYEVITNPKCLPQLEKWSNHPFSKATMWQPLPPRVIKLDEEQVNRIMKIGYKEQPLSGQVSLSNTRPQTPVKKIRQLEENPLKEVKQSTLFF